MDNQSLAEAANINFDAMLDWRCQQLGESVTAVSDQPHGLTDFLICRLKLTVRRMNFRFAAQFKFQCEAP